MHPRIAEILEAARREAATATSWADFSNFLFDPEDGLLPGLFPTEDERRQFIKSPEYAELTKLREEVTERTGLIEGAIPQKTGADVVAFWRREGLIGSRDDISDSQGEARALRDQAERRNT